ncbi:hypothetical protein Chls_682 [Chlamydia suis]|uniref:Uncharacterized protein n=1 Tax=Chlamydia suis TaxID=83559 RepID=A0ABX6IRN1_9CHLA|nr:hypothetical protein Chls_682 [Chlamydia suis]
MKIANSPDKESCKIQRRGGGTTPNLTGSFHLKTVNQGCE